MKTTSTRTRVTAIPALLAAGALASMPGVLKSVAAQGASTPAASPVTEVPAAFADLGLPELSLTLTADAVEGAPESTAAGRYLLTVSGPPPTDEEGPGGIMILQLPEGMTLDDAMAADSGAENQDAPPAFYYQSILPGGPEIGPSGSGVAVIDLVPGDWIVAGAALSTPPSFMTVTGEMPATLPEPESNATFTIGEYVIELSEGELHAGENLIRIDNIGAQPHFVTFEKVPDGTTRENIEATLQVEMGGTPGPGAVDMSQIIHAGASADQSSGTTMWMPLTLEVGTYAALCFIPDIETGMPHALMGMYNVFDVTG